MTGFGNDWYVIPIEQPVNSLLEARSLVVTDTFGVRTLLSPNDDPFRQSTGHWTMLSIAFRVEQGDTTEVALSNLFYLPPTLVRPLEGRSSKRSCCCATKSPTSHGRWSAGSNLR